MGGINNFTNNKICYDVCSGRGNRRNVYQCPWRCTTNNITHQNGASITKYANSDQKFICIISLKKKHPAHNNKGYGNAIPLDEVSRCPRALQILLETEQTELIWLLWKAPPSVPSQIEEIQSVYTSLSTQTIKKCKITNSKES